MKKIINVLRELISFPLSSDGVTPVMGVKPKTSVRLPSIEVG
ncbi:hypothetical protein [Metallosphaera tengchongensis]|nr:hypothetical protein [Metallosphaera tengchongensis]